MASALAGGAWPAGMGGALCVDPEASSHKLQAPSNKPQACHNRVVQLQVNRKE